MAEEQQHKILLLNHTEFEKIRLQRSSDFGDVPTPAITWRVRERSNILTDMVAIDDSFLPDEKREEYFRCLVGHELSEVSFYIKNPDKYKEAVERAKKGEKASPEAHRHALREELRLAKQLDILDEYSGYWRDWMEDKLKETDDEEIKKAIEERIKWREEALTEVREESEQKENELKKFMR